MNSHLCTAEAVALQDVVGERVPEQDGADLFDAAHSQLPQVPVAPAGMDAFTYRTGLVPDLAALACHPRAPGQYSRAVAAPRQVRIGAVLGLSGWTKDLDALGMRALDVLCAAKAAAHEMAFGQAARTRALPLQHGTHQATIGPGVAYIDVNDELLAGRTRHLHIITRTEAAVGHLHHPCIGVRRGGARLLRLLAVAALFFALLALLLDLGKRRLRRLHVRPALTRGPLFGRLDALIAATRARVDLALEVSHRRLSQGQMPLECRLAPERGGSRAGPDPHPILRQRLQIDEARLRQRRQVLAEQPVQQIGATDPEVCQHVMVHRYPAAQPTIGIVAVAQPLQSARAADPLAGGIEPQRQQKPGRCRRVTGAVAPRLDPVLQIAQVKPFDIGPDQAHRMVFSDQALDIHRAQRDLVALRLTQTRRAERHRFGWRLRLRRQFPKQLIGTHHLIASCESIIARESHRANFWLYCLLSRPKNHTL